MSRTLAVVAPIVAAALSACAKWQPLAVPTPAPLDSKAAIEFHAKGKLVHLHGVQFSKDSVSGIPWIEHLSCDTCRVAYPLADVTGLRTGNPGAGAWVIAVPILVVTSMLVSLMLQVPAWR